MQVRRVVTGHDAEGRAVFVRDEHLGAVTVPGLGELAFLWSADEPAMAPEPIPEMHIEDGDEPGMHRTDTTDFGVVLSGNVVVEVDDGAELLLSPGDVVVQNGTRHRWRVAGDRPATMAAFMIGARHR